MHRSVCWTINSICTKRTEDFRSFFWYKLTLSSIFRSAETTNTVTFFSCDRCLVRENFVLFFNFRGPAGKGTGEKITALLFSSLHAVVLESEKKKERREWCMKYQAAWCISRPSDIDTSARGRTGFDDFCRSKSRSNKVTMNKNKEIVITQLKKQIHEIIAKKKQNCKML